MSEKVISINLDAAKTRIKGAGEQAISTTTEKLKSASEGIKGRITDRKDKVLSSLVDKGIDLSKKQLKALEGMKNKKSR